MLRQLPVLLFILLPGLVQAAPDAAALFRQHCAECHGADRLGRMGPALLPENLVRLRKPQAAKVIRDGRPATQMPAFGGKLDDDRIAALVNYIYTPLPRVPTWGEAEIRASRIVHVPPGSLPDKPVYDADPLNLFVVVELGDHHATILDGDRLKPLFRFKTRLNLHGGPKYSPSGRYVYFASRDGWISKFDLYNLKTTVEIRAGINTRNLAVSGDGRYVLVGNYLPHSLVLLDARDLSLIKVIPARGLDGKTSRVSAVYSAPPRGSFIVALKDIPEVWEISYLDEPEPVYIGPMHDYQYEEGAVDRGPFPIRRIRLDSILDDFFFDPPYAHLIGASRDGNNAQVINLIVGRKIATIDLPGMPHLGSGITWTWHGHPVFATPNLRTGEVTVVDMTDWHVVKRIKTLGPGFFMRSHENTPYAWVDVFFGPHRDKVHVIDKRTLEIVRTLQPAPGKVAAHVEFDRYGKYALLSIWDRDGAVVIYDAATLQEIKRLPMNKPSGKYNVWNKIRRSAGTSH